MQVYFQDKVYANIKYIEMFWLNNLTELHNGACNKSDINFKSHCKKFSSKVFLNYLTSEESI